MDKKLLPPQYNITSDNADDIFNPIVDEYTPEYMDITSIQDTHNVEIIATMKAHNIPTI